MKQRKASRVIGFAQIIITGIALILWLSCCKEASKAEQSAPAAANPPVADLIKRFGIHNSEIDTEAFLEAVHIGSSGVQSFIQAYKGTQDPWVRAEICFLFGRSGALESIPFLLETMEDESGFNFYVQRATIHALGELRAKSAVKVLVDNLQRPDLRYLLQIRRDDETAFRKLAGTLGVLSPGTMPSLQNDWIALALGKIATDESLSELKRLSTDDDPAFITPEIVAQARRTALKIRRLGPRKK